MTDRRTQPPAKWLAPPPKTPTLSNAHLRHPSKRRQPSPSVSPLHAERRPSKPAAEPERSHRVRRTPTDPNGRGERQRRPSAAQRNPERLNRGPTMSRRQRNWVEQPPSPQQNAKGASAGDASVASRLLAAAAAAGGRMRARALKFVRQRDRKQIALYLLFAAANVACFVYSGVASLGSEYDTMHSISPAGSLFLSRGSALAINLNSALLCLLMCRHTLTFLRSKLKLGRYILLEDHKMYHKTVGRWLFICSCVHTVGHLTTALTMARRGFGISFATNALVRDPSQIIRHPSIITGILLLSTVLAITVTAIPRIRQRAFNLFWYTHHLFIVYYVLLLMHGGFCYLKLDTPDAPSRTPPRCARPLAWMFMVLPLAILACEKGARWFFSSTAAEWMLLEPRHRISRIIMHPSSVTEIQFKPPLALDLPGGYVFLNVPELGRLQWHPFSLTSEPSMPYSSVHVRSVGDWTRALHELLKDKDGSDDIPDAASRASRSAPLARAFNRAPRINVDGAFSTITEDVFRSEVAVLIGGGIGVTPCASVLRGLQSSLERTKNLKALYFFWIIRDLSAIEWFETLLEELEADPRLNQILSIHVYYTGKLDERQLKQVKINAALSTRNQLQQLPLNPVAAAPKGQVYGTLLKTRFREGDGVNHIQQMILDDGSLTDSMIFQDGSDPLTGLLTPTFFGRPYWSAIFADISGRHRAQNIDVFFCGPKPMVPVLQEAIDREALARESHYIRFHKENF